MRFLKCRLKECLANRHGVTAFMRGDQVLARTPGSRITLNNLDAHLRLGPFLIFCVFQ